MQCSPMHVLHDEVSPADQGRQCGREIVYFTVPVEGAFRIGFPHETKIVGSHSATKLVLGPFLTRVSLQI